jgi:hypothetical protein
MQVYDVLNFDMIVMLRLPYVPGVCEWIYKVSRGSSSNSSSLGSCTKTSALHLIQHVSYIAGSLSMGKQQSS